MMFLTSHNCPNAIHTKLFADWPKSVLINTILAGWCNSVKTLEQIIQQGVLSGTFSLVS